MTQYEWEEARHREKIEDAADAMFDHPRARTATVGALAGMAGVSRGAAHVYLKQTRNCTPWGPRGEFTLKRPSPPDDIF